MGSEMCIRDSAKAIDEVVAWAQPGDAVIVVGKGHEVGQLIGDTMHHFDDREEMARALDEVLRQSADGASARYGDNDKKSHTLPQEQNEPKEHA